MSENFSAAEFFCPCPARCVGKRDPHPSLPLKLEVVRQFVGRPLALNSGVRCPEHNLSVGGVPGSEHETGEGADIRISGSKERMDLVRAAIKAGIRRIGVAKTFVHVGVSRRHDQDVLWLY